MRRPGRLSEAQVLDIRDSYARGYKSAAQLGAVHGMTAAGIMVVVQGRTYKAVGGKITVAGDEPPKRLWRVRGWCRQPKCRRPIADAGWPQRMHLCQECYDARGGRHCGRRPKGKTRSRRCQACNKLFRYYWTEGRHRPKACSVACGRIVQARNNTRRPADMTPLKLHELYWTSDKSLHEIGDLLGFDASTVRLWLLADGTPMRARKRRTYEFCVVDGCNEPRYPKMSYHGTPYGRLCREHLNERERRRAGYVKDAKADAGSEVLMASIYRLTAGLPDAVKVDAEQEIVLAALSGELSLPLTRESVKPLISKVFKENADAWRFISLAAPTHEGEDAQTWGDRLGIC